MRQTELQLRCSEDKAVDRFWKIERHPSTVLQGINVTLRGEHGARDPRCNANSSSRRLVNTALVDYYRCPESFANVELKGRLSDDTGYFRFGQDTICYGHSASGFRASRADAVLSCVATTPDLETERGKDFCTTNLIPATGN